MPRANDARLVARAASKNEPAEIAIYGEIDPYYGISAKEVREAVKDLGDVDQLIVRINSPGGSIFEGLAIYALLRDHQARVTVKVDGVALSMGSVVAMAGDVIEAAENSFFMIHNPLNIAFGESEDLRHMADLLDKFKTQLVAIYARRTKQDESVIAAKMDEETWFTAEEAVAFGLADRTSDQLAIAASFDKTRFSNVPAGIARADNPNHGGRSNMTTSHEESTKNTQPETEPAAAPKVATFEDLKSCLPGADAEFVCQQLERKATLDQAQSAWMEEQNKRIAAAEARAAEARQQAEQAANKPKKPGVTVNGEETPKADGGDGDPVAEWDAAVATNVAKGMKPLKAVLKADQQNPGLRERMLAAVEAAR